MIDSRLETTSIEKQGAWVMAGQLGGLGLNALAGLILAKILGPGVYGIWQAMFVVNLWVGRFHAGSMSTLARELPVALEEDRQQEASALNRASFSVFVIGCAILAVLGVMLALLSGSADTLAWVALCAAFPLIAFRLYAYERLAAQRAFISRTVVMLIAALVFLLAAWALAPQFGLNGVVAANLLQAVVVLAVMGWGMGLSPGLTFSPLALLRVIRAGWPFWLATMLATLDGTAGRLLVLAMLPARELGFYGLALTAALPLVTLASSLEVAMRPRLMVIHARGEKAEQVQAANLPAVPAACWLVALLMGLAYCLAPEFVVWFLPDYVDSLPALKIMILAAWFPFAALGCQSLLLAADEGRAVLIGQGVSAVLKLGLGFWWLWKGLGVGGMAAAYLLGEVVKAVWFIKAAWPHMSGGPSKGWLELVLYNTPLVLAALVLLVGDLSLGLLYGPLPSLPGLWLALLFVVGGGPIAFVANSFLNRAADHLRPPNHRRLPLAGHKADLQSGSEPTQ